MSDRKLNQRKIQNDVGKMLLGQIQLLVGSGYPVIMKREKPWASITFSGTRHYLEIGCPESDIGSQMIAVLNQLPEHEFDLPGYFVADLLVRDYEPQDRGIEIEALTIVDPVRDQID